MIVPYTPQHNIVAKKMNRTIIEKIKSVLSHIKLPKRFWDEVLRILVDFINISSCTPLYWNIVGNTWTRKNVSYKHVRVFNCRIFTYVLDVECSKLDDKRNECIFLGYYHDKFGYKLWHLVKQRVLLRKDIFLFWRSKYWRYEESSSGKKLYRSILHCDQVVHHVHHDEGGNMQEKKNGDDAYLLIRQDE